MTELNGNQRMKNVVIVGQGYVGLPLALAASSAGHSVTGLERSAGTVQSLMAGRSHIDDVSDAALADGLRSGYSCTDREEVLLGADVVVICVPTPLSSDGGPDLSAVESAVRSIARNPRRGQTVILESTTYPGTTEEVVLPILESDGQQHGEDFYLAFSPERVDPGNEKYGIVNTPKLVGGLTPAATKAAADFYSSFVDTVVTMRGAREAEMAKLLENTYRHVNIALVNEMARFSHDLGIDIWDVINGASTKPFGYQAFWPGPGVGGHCIPIDPNYLSHQIRTRLGYSFRFVELAQEINNTMPEYVVRRAQDLLNRSAIAMNGAKVLLVGVTYKADIADQRESPIKPLAEGLATLGADLRYFDPLVPDWHLGDRSLSSETDLVAACEGADLTIVLQAHKAVDFDMVSRHSRRVLDTRGVVRGRDVERI